MSISTIIILFTVGVVYFGLKMLKLGFDLENTRRANDRLARLEAQNKALQRLWIDVQKPNK